LGTLNSKLKDLSRKTTKSIVVDLQEKRAKMT
jgi:hypothetical protein